MIPLALLPIGKTVFPKCLAKQPLHDLKPGDLSFWKRHQKKKKPALKPQQEKTLKVLLTIGTAVKFQGVDPWGHVSQIEI